MERSAECHLSVALTVVRNIDLSHIRVIRLIRDRINSVVLEHTEVQFVDALLFGFLSIVDSGLFG